MDVPHPQNIREMGFSDNFVSKSSPELSHEDVDPVVVALRRESSRGHSPLMKLKGKRAMNIALSHRNYTSMGGERVRKAMQWNL